MINRYDEEGWNNHALELKVGSLGPCRFEGPHLIHAPNIGPLPAELQWLRTTLLALPDVRRVLDFGCGIGLFTGLFEGFEYTGADLTDSMLSEARSNHPEKRFIKASGVALLDTFSPGSFDLVFHRAVLQHNQGPEKDDIIRGLHALLRSGGFYLWHEHGLIPDMQTEEVRSYVESFGFTYCDSYLPYAYVFQKNDSTF